MASARQQEPKATPAAATTTSSSAASSDPPANLPPFVHAIGGSIGSALAIFIFYPLERVRVELQSRGGDGGSPGSGRRAEPDGGSSGEAGSDGGVASSSAGYPGGSDDVVQRIHGGSSSSSTPESSSAGSFEVVSQDAEISFDEIDDDRDAGSAPNQSSKGPLNSASRARAELKPGRQKDEHHDVKHDSPTETISQCLVRLYNEQTLYKGASHMVTTLMISNAVFFYALQVMRRRLAYYHHLRQNNQHRHHYQGRKNRALLVHYMYQLLLPRSKMGNSLMASSMAGCINVLLTNPLWVASLRIMESKLPVGDEDSARDRQTLWNVMDRIVRTEGASQLWNGTCTSLLLVSNPIIQHFLYEQLRAVLLDRRRRRSRPMAGRGMTEASSLSPLEAFAFGALAKTVATVVTYPLQLAQVLLRLQRKTLHSPSLPRSTPACVEDRDPNEVGSAEIAFEGTFDCLCRQYASGGVQALFQGMNAKLLQTVLTAAFTFLTYEQTLYQVGRVYKSFGSKR